MAARHVACVATPGGQAAGVPLGRGRRGAGFTAGSALDLRPGQPGPGRSHEKRTTLSVCLLGQILYGPMFSIKIYNQNSRVVTSCSSRGENIHKLRFFCVLYLILLFESFRFLESIFLTIMNLFVCFKSYD